MKPVTPNERTLEFDVLLKDKLLHSVKINFNENTCYIKTFTHIPIEKEFTKDTLNLMEMLRWVESRCFERNRDGREEILELLGLKAYEPYEIIKVTHGLMAHDKRWIRFKGEDLTYEQAIEDLNAR